MVLVPPDVSNEVRHKVLSVFILYRIDLIDWDVACNAVYAYCMRLNEIEDRSEK